MYPTIWGYVMEYVMGKIVPANDISEIVFLGWEVGNPQTIGI
jgi:hypothetical protein